MRHLTRPQKAIAAVVTTGGVIIAGIGFAGSYSAVRALAERQGFGPFAVAFPIGVDAGICVLLALDLLLTWLRIPFPLLRQTAWLLTAATIAFNAAAAWPDPLGVGMHAVIPVLFVVTVEAARHAIGRTADITADKHMEGVRLTRWLLAPIPTFLLWRRMKLWELRSYEQTIRLERDRLTYQARLHSRFGRAWRRKAPVESIMPLRLARYGVPLTETAPAGLAAAGVTSTPRAAGALAASAEQAPPAPTAEDPDDVAYREYCNAVHQYDGFPTRQQLDAYRNATPATRDEPTATRNAVEPDGATGPAATTATPLATPVATAPPGATPITATAGSATATPATLPAATPDDSAARRAAEEAARTVADDLDGVTLLTTAQVAALKGVTQGTVRSWVSRGHLKPALRDANGRNHFHPAAIAELD